MDYTFTVKRIRHSVTQGSAVVYLNGEEMGTFGDEPVLLQNGDTEYYGENIGGWASKTPDSSFIYATLFHELDYIYNYSRKVKLYIDKERCLKAEEKSKQKEAV